MGSLGSEKEGTHSEFLRGMWEDQSQGFWPTLSQSFLVGPDEVYVTLDSASCPLWAYACLCRTRLLVWTISHTGFTQPL